MKLNDEYSIFYVDCEAQYEVFTEYDININTFDNYLHSHNRFVSYMRQIDLSYINSKNYSVIHQILEKLHFSDVVWSRNKCIEELKSYSNTDLENIVNQSYEYIYDTPLISVVITSYTLMYVSMYSEFSYTTRNMYEAAKYLLNERKENNNK